MRLVRFSIDNSKRCGIIEGDKVLEVEDFILSGSAAAANGLKRTGRSYPFEALSLLAPVAPSKIIAIGLNYRAHAAEFNKALPKEPMLFMKPPSAVIGPGDEILYPAHMSRRVDFEAELAVVIGRRARGVSAKDAPQYILGYSCFNDVTARDLQGRDVQYTRAKGFDTFAPLGPWIETSLDPDDVMVEAYLNGEKRQSSSTSDMIFGVCELVSFISRVMTLLAGDVIATGTPSGVGKMKPGDTVEIRIEGIGSLENTVREG